ncbi:MAG: protein of unknown function transrane [Anaerocolumna sp.]|jgi:drug/metabolite transporter (DMT)-like permease|nr:protein of unknown function transrane [Anaerocolumna sp.]
MKKHIGTFGLLIVAIIWGMGFVANEIALATMTPMQILSGRFLIATVIMSIVVIVRKVKIGKEELFAGLILGLFLFVGFATQTIGLKYTTPSKNAFLTAANVVIVPFIAFIIYKKKVDKFSITGAFLAILGIGILSLNGNLTLGFGDGLTLICAIAFAFQIFFTGEYVKKYNVLALNAIQMTVAFLLSFATILITGETSFHINQGGINSTIYLGVLSTTVAFFLQTLFQKYTDQTTAAVVLSMESVFGTLFSVLIVGEVITPRMLLGCSLIFIAVITAETKLSWIRETKKLEVNNLEA